MYLRGGAFDSQSSTGNGAATVAGSNEAVDTTKNTVVPTNEDVENLSDEDETKGATKNGEKTWGDFADTRWYVGHEDATEYHIATVEELAGLAKLVNEQDNSVMFKGKTVCLDNDLDLAGYEWISIGNGLNQGKDPDGYYSFCGTFDGQGHVISNLYSHDSLLDNEDNFIPDSNLATPHGRDVYKTGLFGSVYKGTIKNLGVENADIWIDPNDVSTYGEGILVDFLEYSTVENCWTTGSITGGKYFEKFIGGVVGTILGDCSVSGCYSKATITGNYDGSGYTDPNGAKPMDNYDSLGGIVGGMIYGNVTISDCWFDGEIAVNSIQAAVGGIAGYIDGEVKNCLVATTDIGKDSIEEEANTCWVGYLGNGTVANNYWYTDDKYKATPLDEGVNKAAGTAVSDFKSADVLTGLQTNAGEGIEWVAGIKHPTFAWDKRNISADYTKVDEAIAAAKAIDGSHYTNYDAVEAAVNAVDRTKSKAEQDKVDAMAKTITDAIAALVEKSNNSSSSGGGGGSTPRYAVTVPDKTENGSLSVTPKNAKKGSDVTITATPDKGYEVNDIVAKDAKGNKLTLKDNGDGTYTFTMPASKVTIEATFAEKQADEPVAPEKLFADVSADDYYYEAVKWASENGVTGGIGENLFGANLPCTRAQIVTFLWRAAGSPEPKGMSGFVDVSADAYYAKAVAWAVEQGIVSGTSATTFNPDAVCTRAQSVAFLYRAFGEKVNKAAGFSDVSADAYYADAVAWAVENGVASGIGGGLFAPDQDCARGQIVAFLYRAYQNK